MNVSVLKTGYIRQFPIYLDHPIYRFDRTFEKISVPRKVKQGLSIVLGKNTILPNLGIPKKINHASHLS